jgi:hypothetical protein
MLTASSTNTRPTLADWLRRAARTSDRVLATVLSALPAAASNAVLVAILVLTVGDLTTDVGSHSSSADALAPIESERIIHLIVSTAMLERAERPQLWRAHSTDDRRRGDDRRRHRCRDRRVPTTGTGVRAMGDAGL